MQYAEQVKELGIGMEERKRGARQGVCVVGGGGGGGGGWSPACCL